MPIGKTANRRSTCLYWMLVYVHLLTIILLLTCTGSIVAEEINHQRASEALRQAVAFFRTQVSIAPFLPVRWPVRWLTVGMETCFSLFQSFPFNGLKSDL